MASYRATVDWTLEPDADFAAGRYSRGHAIIFEGGYEVPGTASPHVVGNKWSVEGAVDPEQMMVGSISACHMLTFLHMARNAGFVVTSYRDEAVGVMATNAAGRMAVTKVALRPDIAYEGKRPTPEEADHLHHQAHEECFIANSVTTEIVVEEVSPAGV